MAKVQVLNVVVLDNPSPFNNPFQFEITFECIEDLPDGEGRTGPGDNWRLRGVVFFNQWVVNLPLWRDPGPLAHIVHCPSIYCSVFVLHCLPLVDLEWKIIYVGSAESEEHDQVLDSVLVGPVPAGRHMFVFQVLQWSAVVRPQCTKKNCMQE